MEENTNIMNQEAIETLDTYTSDPVDLVNSEDCGVYYDDESDDVGSVAGLAAGVTVLGFAGYGAVKLSQWAYEKIQTKRGKPVLCREKWYQFYRPKRPKSLEEKSQENKGRHEAVDTGFEEVDSDSRSEK